MSRIIAGNVIEGEEAHSGGEIPDFIVQNQILNTLIKKSRSLRQDCEFFDKLSQITVEKGKNSLDYLTELVNSSIEEDEPFMMSNSSSSPSEGEYTSGSEDGEIKRREPVKLSKNIVSTSTEKGVEAKDEIDSSKAEVKVMNSYCRIRIVPKRNKHGKVPQAVNETPFGFAVDPDLIDNLGIGTNQEEAFVNAVEQMCKVYFN